MRKIDLSQGIYYSGILYQGKGIGLISKNNNKSGNLWQVLKESTNILLLDVSQVLYAYKSHLIFDKQLFINK